MNESTLGVLGGLAIAAAVWVVLTVPDLLNALVRRIGGRAEIRACADCGNRLAIRDGSTCPTCRDIRRQRLAQGPDGRAAAESNGDNGS